VYRRRHPWSAVGIDLKVSTFRTRPCDFAAIESELHAARRAGRTRFNDGCRHGLPLRIGKSSARYRGDVDVTLAGDIPAQRNRADEVQADKIRTEGASQNFRYLITEHGDFARDDHAHERLRNLK